MKKKKKQKILKKKENTKRRWKKKEKNTKDEQNEKMKKDGKKNIQNMRNLWKFLSFLISHSKSLKIYRICCCCNFFRWNPQRFQWLFRMCLCIDENQQSILGSPRFSHKNCEFSLDVKQKRCSWTLFLDLLIVIGWRSCRRIS